ncbi:hypothetical protein C095_01235 [Fusobacterium necrophorum subsp. funduliforme B35]|nr:hypothetical protein C095_01235 [Fusobacterium necrophorum subsp. funduliforme B35]
MRERKNKMTGESAKDIHENNQEYLEKSYQNACDMAERYHWIRISCVDGERIKSMEEIQKEIWEKVREV